MASQNIKNVQFKYENFMFTHTHTHTHTHIHTHTHTLCDLLRKEHTITYSCQKNQNLNLIKSLNLATNLLEIQTYCRDIMGTVPDNHNKKNIVIKWVTWICWFPSAYKSYVGRVRWLMPIIPALWEAEVGRSWNQEIKTTLANMMKPRLY